MVKNYMLGIKANHQSKNIGVTGENTSSLLKCTVYLIILIASELNFIQVTYFIRRTI